MNCAATAPLKSLLLPRQTSPSCPSAPGQHLCELCCYCPPQAASAAAIADFPELIVDGLQSDIERVRYCRTLGPAVGRALALVAEGFWQTPIPTLGFI